MAVLKEELVDVLNDLKALTQVTHVQNIVTKVEALVAKFEPDEAPVETAVEDVVEKSPDEVPAVVTAVEDVAATAVEPDPTPAAPVVEPTPAPVKDQGTV